MGLDRNDYNVCARMCSKVYKKIIYKLKDEKNVNKLCIYGTSLINEYCNDFMKSNKNKKAGVSFPVCISLNNCIGYTDYSENDITDSDVVKIELGIYVNDSLAILGETFTMNKLYTDTINFLDVLKKDIVKNIKDGVTNDDVKMFIESECTKNKCFPIENCFTYQNIGNQLNSEESKYMLLNYIPYYDEDDNAIIDNFCFEFEKDEVYTVNIIVVNSDDRLVYKNIDTCIYKFSDYFYNLKLKSSREFFSNAKKAHENNAFYIKTYNNSAKNRIGIKECVDNNLLDEYQTYSLKHKISSTENLIVFHKKFTIIVDKNKSILLDY